jgi:hypothetical protein
VSDHLLALIYGVFAATIAAIAIRVQLLPEVIDISIIPTFAGLGSIAFTTYGALRRFDPDRIAPQLRRHGARRHRRHGRHPHRPTDRYT